MYFDLCQYHEMSNKSLTLALFPYTQRKLEGYKFPVYTTQSCPSNETEWEARSSVFNCQGESSYACFPNENITELLEFCYPFEVISIHEGKTLISSRENCTLFVTVFINFLVEFSIFLVSKIN